MAIKTYNDQNFVAIANAIRAKNGETTQYKPSEMAPAIMAIESGLELLPQDTVAGAIANFPDGSNNYLVVELIANIDPKQSGSGDPSPSNVRPISGYTGMNITKQGKNLADGNMTQDGATRVILINNIFLKAGSYTISITCDTARHFYYREHGVSTWTLLGGYSKKVVTFTIENDNYYDFSYYHTNGVNISELSDLQLEAGSSVTAYEPYAAPEVKTISWESEAGTVYGGTLNVTTGVLTVNRKYKIFTGAESEEWSFDKSGDYYRFRTPISDIKIEGAGRKEVLSNIGFYSSSSAYYVIFGYRSTTVNYIYYYAPSGIETVADFKSWLSANNMQVVYDIETPQVYQLTPEQVKTLLGVNNIYADTGDVEVTYRADIDLYIAKKIAEGA